VTRVFLVEDHPLMRETIARLVAAQGDFEVVGTAATAGEALRSVPEANPDLVLVDLSLPDRSGSELIAELIAAMGGVVALVVSGHDESLYADAAIRAGARGFVMKDDPDEIVTAIRAVLAGETYRSDRLA
jgi:DNA-binding NarL/FixJ family response regulator